MRLIDADALEKKLNERYDYLLNENGPYDHFTDGYEEATSTVEDFPTVDAEVVVRCKDCKHSTLPSELTQRYGVPGTLTCHNRRSPCNRRNVGGDDFCSYGERKVAP